ncbi:aldolase [Amphibiibacter pelophylacis]|uniref:Aldolase n=1 Tax=Amphibiibacter pelophylacis TaxID=1799477 RepID=A0ACC6NYN3_9BURK
MSEDQARADICAVGRSLFERGYVHATAGNISVRLPDGGFLMTPTDACLGRLVPDRLARIAPDGQQVSGDRASKTLVLHRRIYAATADTARPAGCVIHTHSTHLVAASLAQSGALAEQPEGAAAPDLLPPITPYFVMKVGHVPHIAYRRPGAPQAADAVEAAIAAHHAAEHPIAAVMLARLGPNVWHSHLFEAMALLEELEETARLWLLGQSLATPPDPLDPDQIAELRQQFGAHW